MIIILYKHHCSYYYEAHINIGVYFELKGVRYENNSVVNIHTIGEGDSALLCKTDNPDCCSCSRLGTFYNPCGAQVPAYSSQHQCFYRKRGDQVIRLNRKNGTSSPTGRYTCEIPDADGITQKIFINIIKC